MNPKTPPPPPEQIDFEPLKELLVDVAQERRLDQLLDRVARGLLEGRTHIARVCVWLTDT